MNRINLLLIVVLASISVKAQETKKLPGNPELVSSKETLAKLAAAEKGQFKYSVESYFKKPKVTAFGFSPDGKYFSYREKDDKGKSHVYIKNIATNEIKKAIIETDELVRSYWWANNDRLIYTKDKGGNENYMIYAVNIDGTNEKALTPFENVKVDVIEELKEQKDYIIIQMNKDNPEVFEPYKLNIVTGDLVKLYENKDNSSPIMGYDFDKDGNLKAITRQVNGNEYHLLYRTSKDSPFELVEKTNWKNSFGIANFNYNSKNPNEAYVVSNLNSDKKQIQRYDLKEHKVLEVLFEDKTYDVSGIRLARKRNYEIDSYSYAGEKGVMVPISTLYKKIDKKLKATFGQNSYAISDYTENEDKFLIYVYSDKLYGAYYVYDIKSDKVTKMLDLMPDLNEKDMAEMRPIQFKSRDGLILHGYLTIPNNIKNKKVPLIVNPHGGPYGPRDNWGFNPETQLFASRGYATLQINYRGSGGYGKEFFLAGAKQIGRKMLNDLEDGVQYVVDMGLVDKDNVAIYGGSYGGLATLGSLVKTPDLYKCGVDYVGVSNLFTFMNTFPPYWKPFVAQVYEQWYDPTNAEEKKIMEQVSPALNIDKITKPLFIVQGANDPRVNIDESDQMVSGLRKRGVDVPYMVKYNEGHGFHHEDNRIDLYKTMMGFFSQHLKTK
ncbi:S9 family peptidase [Flavobacterium sp. '19STA2R22 D10 B1']|uniref:S9 family peptidase n=1 Tax=Flavobacterium aerium TaxID=3037261 RepID=UPI00278C25B1|nr:S9 family peptidase [Flavobacterium sp. '19STA2R22 D10 B1']